MRKFTKYPSTIKASSKGTFHMSSTTFDKMARENSLMYGLDKSEYDEVRDLADSGNIRRDGLVNTIAVSSNITLDEADKILRKYESITLAQFVPARQLGMFNYRYEVHCDTSSRPDVLLAASDNLQNAEAMAKRQIDRIASSPWESKENKLRSLDSLYIFDIMTNDEATTQAVEDYIELAKQKVEKQPVKSSNEGVACASAQRNIDRYEVHWTTSSGLDRHLGSSKTLKGAEDIAIREIRALTLSRTKSTETKQQILETIYIYDTVDDNSISTDNMNYEADHAADKLRKQDSNNVTSSTNLDMYDLQWNDVVNLLNDYKKESDEVIRINDNGVVVTSADDDYTYAASKEYLLDKANSTIDAYQHYMEDPSAIMDLIDEKVVYAEDHRSVSGYRKEKKEILNKYGFGRPSKKVEQSEEVCCFTKSDDDDFDYDSVDYNADSEYQPERDEIEMGMSWDFMDGQFTYTVTGFQAGRVLLSMDGYENGEEVHEDLVAIKKKDEAGEYLTTRDNPYLKLYAVEGYIPDSDYDKHYTSAYRGDYSPSNPWDAPGMSYRDFI